MQPTKHTFAGYLSGETDFAALLSHTVQQDFLSLLDVIEIVKNQVVNPAPNVFVALCFTGHADRNLTAGLSEQARRISERDASEDRAQSAWHWFRDRVTESVVADGAEPGEWWDLPFITLAGGSCGAVWLVHENPANEAEREANRRVIVQASIFSS